MSTYLINQFDNKNSNSLSSSIIVNNIKNLPEILLGSVSCVSFVTFRNTIYICLPNQEEAMAIIRAFLDFQKCRDQKGSKNIFNVLKGSCKF